MTEHQHTEIAEPAKKTSKSWMDKTQIALTLMMISIAVFAWMAVDANNEYHAKYQDYQSLLTKSIGLKLEAQEHRAAGASHRAAMMEEAVRDSESKEVTIKRLALSIALTRKDTGFEDRLIEAARVNSSDESLTPTRNSFLTSLFEIYPPALKHQEGIQMQMDALIEELRRATDLIVESENVGAQADEALKVAQEAQGQERHAFQAMILMSLALGSLLFVTRPTER